MFIIYDKTRQRVPIKVWLESEDQLEEQCLQQALNLSNLPFVYKWVALMPDTHSGYGMPIGGVIGTIDTIIPNAVGVDIGCGVAFVDTNIKADSISRIQYEEIVSQIMNRVPTGFDHHRIKQQCKVLDKASIAKKFKKNRELYDEIENGYYQVGTLGGGNHFIELQEDDDGMLGIMVHSGSRNFGFKIANYYNEVAKGLNKKMGDVVPRHYDLAYLPTDSQEGKEYIMWMNLALDFARENRSKIMETVQDVLYKNIDDIEFGGEINAHHNYASYERHYEKDVWIHRKGAIYAGKDVLGIIPGAMGSYSYIVKGLGNPESFKSCSHGAGRELSRRAAKEEYPVEHVVEDLESRGVILGKTRLRDVAEEYRKAYKDIDFVISQQLDLIQPIKRLKTIAVIKG